MAASFILIAALTLTPADVAGLRPRADRILRIAPDARLHVRISAAAGASPELSDPAIELLSHQLDEISALIPPPALALLREIPVWIEHKNCDRPCACHDGSPMWLRANGYIVEKTRGVVMGPKR